MAEDLQDKLSQMEEFVFDRMKETSLPAVSMAVIKGDRVVYSRGFGKKDLESGTPATSATLYGIGSITKSFTCLALMQLRDKGKLNLEDPVSRYLDFNIKPKDQETKIWHLMTHTSGIPALAYAEAVIRNSVGDDVRDVPIGDVEDMLTFMEESENWVETAPGERWFYLNEGYVLLGGIIERISGETYEDYINENILQPLEMERTCFDKSSVESEADAATPYLIRGGERSPKDYLYGSISSDGGIISSVDDMASYLKLFICGDENIVSDSSLKEMMKSRISTPARRLYERSESGTKNSVIEAKYDHAETPRYYGYGLGINPNFMGYTRIGHGGSVLVSTAQMDFIPEKDLGIVLLSNGSGYPLSNLSRYTLALLLDENPEKLAFRVGEKRLEQLTGVYRAYKNNMQIDVSRQGDTLILEPSTSPDQRIFLVPNKIGEDEIICSALQGGRRLPVEFYLREDGIELLYGRYKLRKNM